MYVTFSSSERILCECDFRFQRCESVTNVHSCGVTAVQGWSKFTLFLSETLLAGDCLLDGRRSITDKSFRFFFFNSLRFEFLTVKGMKNNVGYDAVYSYRYISNFTIISCRDSVSLWAGRFGVRALVGGLIFFSFPHSSIQVLGSIPLHEQ